MRKFISNEDGGVTIDWVFITGGILLLGIAVVFGVFNQGVSTLATSINTEVATTLINPELAPSPDQQRFAQGG